MQKPSERIKEIMRESYHGGLDFDVAIMDYLDEQAAKQGIFETCEKSHVSEKDLSSEHIKEE